MTIQKKDISTKTTSVRSMEKYAPVVIFAFNRLECLNRLLESIESNDKLSEMDLHIFVDKARDDDEDRIETNKTVIERVYSYVGESSFREVFINVANSHRGLANSIISGVTQVIDRYGKVIVLEDDLVVASDFLTFMNRALDYYADDDRIWSVSGWSLTPEKQSNQGKMLYLFPRGNSLGWGMWKDRWDLICWNDKSFYNSSIIRRLRFNLGGNDLSRMLHRQMSDSKFDSWAIRWDYNASVLRKKTLYPKQSRVIHDDREKSGTHVNSLVRQQSLRKEYSLVLFSNSVKCGFVDWWYGYWYYSTPMWRRFVSWCYRTFFE